MGLVPAQARHQRRADIESRPVGGNARSESSLRRVVATFDVTPPVKPLSCGPQYHHADDRTGGVDEDIGDHRGAGRDEHLVEFIGGGIKENNEDGDGGFAPTPRTGVAAGGFADCAPEEGGENGVFREVTAFPNDVVDGFDGCLSHVRKQPVKEGFDEPGGMGVGLIVAGADEDQRHPGEGQKPIFQKRAKF